MVSLQAPLSPKEKACLNLANLSSLKRKWEDGQESNCGDHHPKEPKLSKADEETKPDIDLHLNTPLPLEWQRCLDIKSGRIHFYNTRTHTRTSMDPRQSPEPPSSSPSLDLELNLTIEPPNCHDSRPERTKPRDSKKTPSNFSLSWASVDGDDQEMVAAVCMRCHMLVMMCKAAPSCPNCKFVHPPSNRSSSSLLKPGFKLLCCKD